MRNLLCLLLLICATTVAKAQVASDKKSICGISLDSSDEIAEVTDDASTIAFLKSVSGEVWVLRRSVDGAIDRIAAEVGMDLSSLDAIMTGADGSFGAIFTDNSVFFGAADTCLEIASYAYRPSEEKNEFRMRLGRGVVSVAAGRVVKLKGDTMSVRVRNDTNLAVTGTRIVIRAK